MGTTSNSRSPGRSIASAADRLRPWCIRINRWYAALADAANAQGRAALASALRGGRDVDLTIFDCERGKTPSFAEGALVATDAVVRRPRDGFLLLAPRGLDRRSATLPGALSRSAGRHPGSAAQRSRPLAGGTALARPGTARSRPGGSSLPRAACPLPPHVSERTKPLSLLPFLARLRQPPPAQGCADADFI
jgi:hypothetical protein